MKNNKVESVILRGVEKLSRREAQACRGSAEPPWPECLLIFHQPKRPKKVI